MSNIIDHMIDQLIDREGGYCNNPNDLGGATCWGITEAEARANCYTGQMISLPKTFAQEVYLQKYWIKPKFDRVDEIYGCVAVELFDTGVNMGTAKAIEFLQIALNAFNRNGRDYADITEDHSIGPATLRALAEYSAKRGIEGEEVLLKSLNCLQGARYLEISRNRPQNEDFTYGWIKNRIEL